MPRAVLLLPGVGAQGGRLEDLAPAFAAGPASALPSASRSVIYADDPAAAAAALSEQLRAVLSLVG
jgi:orotidine-5'-phosphate decarboxylase